MLEDELREMFGSRVSVPPAADDPAGVAIRRGRSRAARRRLTLGTIAAVSFAAVLGAAAFVKGMVTPSVNPANGQALTYDKLFGNDPTQPEKGGTVTLPSMTLPIDLRIGTALWTSDGHRFTFSGVEEVIEVVRVPAGWLYSDDFRLRLLTLSGASMPVRSNIADWTVNLDGTQFATIVEGTILEVRVPGSETTIKTVVPMGTRPVTFDGTKVVLERGTGGYDAWSATSTPYRETWNNELLAVYGAIGDSAVGLVRRAGTVCLAEVTSSDDGFTIGRELTCGDLPRLAASNVHTDLEATRSPDGRWLAIPSETGVHMIDIHAARAATPSATPVFPASRVCPSSADAPAVWADAGRLLTEGQDSTLIACTTEGANFQVTLPSDVPAGWAMIPRYGVSS